jgi:hypothetical protein
VAETWNVSHQSVWPPKGAGAAESCARCAVATMGLGMIGVPARCATHQFGFRFAGLTRVERRRAERKVK